MREGQSGGARASQQAAVSPRVSLHVHVSLSSVRGDALSINPLAQHGHHLDPALPSHLTPDSEALTSSLQTLSPGTSLSPDASRDPPFFATHSLRPSIKQEGTNNACGSAGYVPMCASCIFSIPLARHHGFINRPLSPQHR